jgi:hypothetical protein
MARRSSKARRQAEIEDLVLLGTHVRMGPLGLYVYAADFLGAAKKAPDARFSPARTFLVCRSIELALKGFLSVNGFRLKELSGGAFGHNLVNVLEEAERQGITSVVALGAKQTDEIRRASIYYGEKIFEYPALGEAVSGLPQNPDTDLLIEVSEKLIRWLQGEAMIGERAGR